tara:strand:+ start:91 stop:1542 length:1452 start_codon:yes stop_codon:yes gene_type:complete
MAYVRSNAGSGIDKAFDNELITRNELYAILDQLKDESQFHQLEIFEVVDVDTENVGSVIGRYVYSEQGDSLEEIGDRTFLPLNSNIIQYPLRGELWLGLDYKGQQFYISRLSRDITDVNYRKINESAISENQTLDLSRGGTYQEISPEHADVEVGDTLIQGRFGNFITLTSRQSQGLDESPRITINNQRSIVDLESIDDIGLINVESDEILMTALTDEVNIRALKDININSSQGDVNIESESNIVLNPRNSTIEFDIKNGGTILSSTKEGIPFPQLDMAGFLKQTMGIQKLFQAFTLGVPKLSNPLTLPSGVKDIVKGLEGAKNFVDATLNLEFLSQGLMETKTLPEIKASLPIPSGLTNVVGDIEEFSKDIEGGIQKAQRFAESNKAKLEQANQISAGIDNGSRRDLLALLENIPAEERDQIPGANDALAIAQDKSVGGGDIPRARDNGVFRLLEDYIAKQGSVEQDVEQLKMYGKILNLTK